MGIRSSEHVRQPIKDIPEGAGDGPVLELAAAGDGGRAAEHGVCHQADGEIKLADERHERPGRRGDAAGQRRRAAFAARRFRRTAAHQGVAGDVKGVCRRGIGRCCGNHICEITDDLESPRRECRDRAGLQRVAEIAAAYAGHEGGRKSCRQDCLAPGDERANCDRPDLEDANPRIGTSRNSTPKLRLKNVLMALPALHRLKEAVAVGIGDAERVVDDVGVAAPRLPVGRVGHERVGADHAADQRVPPVR